MSPGQSERSTTRIDIQTSVPYPVHVGPDALDRLGQLAPRRCVLVADRLAFEHHGDRLGHLANGPHLLVEGGEDAKTLERLGTVLDFLAGAGLDRGSLLVAFGGGSVSDLAGLAAALFLRGIEWWTSPTTLLAQVDASVGGKTAINLAAGKNLAGRFHQPRGVVADSRTLLTLDPKEMRSGLGEVIKSALLGDAEVLARLETTDPVALRRDPDQLAEIVARCVRVKGAIVAEDEGERGRRAVLNLGHTFAHSIERAAGFGRIPHGEAVGTGLALALEASRRAGVLRDAQLPERLGALLTRLDLCPDLAALRARHAAPLSTQTLLEGLRYDKKGVAGEARFVLLEDVGSARPGIPLDGNLLRELLA